MRHHWDLDLAIGFAVVACVLALLVPVDWIRILFVAPLALFLPGYSVTAAVFARRRLERPQVITLSLGLSLAILALGSLLLNYLPGGISAFSWAALLLLVICGCCGTAGLRREHESRTPSLPPWRPGRVEVGAVVVAVLLAVAAVALASDSLPAKNAIGYAELWVVPRPGSGETEALVVVKSEQQVRSNYVLAVSAGKARPSRQSFELRPGETHVLRLDTGAPANGPPVPVVATLALRSKPDKVYRLVKASFGPRRPPA